MKLLPGYEHQIVPGAGLSVGPGAPKVGVHTTETGPGSLQTLITHWNRNWGAGLPHFVQEGARIVELLPIDVAAYTAKNRPGGADINRSGPMIQIEVVSFAAEGWDDVTYDTFARWLADLKTAGHNFDIGQHPRFYGANEGIVLASESSPIRLSASQFDAFNGWLGHQHFPENDHWDPGGIDGDRIERAARSHLGTPAPTIPVLPPDDDEEDDMKAPRPCYSAPSGTFGCRPDGKLAHIGGPDTLTKLTTPNQGNPAELQAPVTVTDGTLETLKAFYGLAD